MAISTHGGVLFYLEMNDFFVVIRLYVQESRLGCGGFGVVYHVVETPSGNDYALKVVPFPENE